MARLRPIIALAVAALVVATGAAGITYAATRATPQVVYGCINAQGVLKLLNVGDCAAGFTKVGIDRSGVRGPRGPRGLRGAPGPGPQYVAVKTTASSPVFDDVLIGAMNLQVRVECNVGGLPSVSRVYVINNGGTANFTVAGSAIANKADGAGISVVHHGTTHGLPDGLSRVEFTQPGSEQSTVQVIADDGGVSSNGSARIKADLTVERSGRTVLLRVYVDQNPTKCRAQAAVIPVD